MVDIKNSIMATKQGFESSFSSGDFYNKQTQDEQHLKRILAFLPFKAGMKILDLGVGSGYLSFPIAKEYPDIQKSISEVSRVIKREGFLFISDPAPNVNDTSRFVDEYMQLKKDGHIRFYNKDEWLQICGKYGLQFRKHFDSTIRFPREKDTAYGFDELLRKHDREIIEGYELEVMGDEIYITEQVNNLLFCKQ